MNDPTCLVCRHDWHGLFCTATYWVHGRSRPTTCTCQTSISTEINNPTVPSQPNREITHE